jgi:hypothetical protein
LYVVYNIGTQFASLAAANPLQLREQRLTLKLTYSFTPGLSRTQSPSNRDAALESEVPVEKASLDRRGAAAH